ncbi:L-asparagine oxygenase [Streptomyces lavendulae subsp. lavendulae]|uniref:TauD/TfdA family dioxygenase n=1 Tax=Streptomyces lavendulae TaxID=1914 RepID=UPI0024A173B8|nr:TauD/TfdA family dioxygenase [Streptomyces lavendulae]GLV84824.1 L-asparagine oxygenase [Streptomyces lavendulae subsp. lavendulae]
MALLADTAVADPEIAHLLGESALALARDGATADGLSPVDVPSGLAEALRTVMRAPDPTTGRLVVRGLLAYLPDPGPTPAHWGVARTESTQAMDLAVRIVAGTVGEVFGWTGQQDGRLVHNILPSRGSEHQQVGASSAVPLYWHSEDAFHPQRAGVLLLACIRNQEGVGSRVASVREAGLTGRQRELLARPDAAILPDDSYPEASPDRTERTALRGIPTIWQGDDGPCIRYDPSYTRFLTDDPEFLDAYEELGRALDQCGTTVPNQPGDLTLIDNDVAVHGRVPFRPRYDGTDRWLKRVLIRPGRKRPAAELAEDGFGEQTVRLRTNSTLESPR